MRPLALAITLGGIGALVLAAPALRARVVQPPPAAVVSQPVAQEASRPAEALPVPFAVRPVAPEVVALPPIEQRTLERIEAREPLSPIGRAHAPSEGPPKETVLHRPLVIEAGAFSSLGYRVTLAGLEPTPADETCVTDGAAWPCGIHARTAFRNWLRGRALACVVPPAPPDEVLVTPCRLGKIDAGEWLVAQGWARAEPDGPYAALEIAARTQNRGIFGSMLGVLAPMAITVPDISGLDLPGPILMESDMPASASGG